MLLSPTCIHFFVWLAAVNILTKPAFEWLVVEMFICVQAFWGKRIQYFQHLDFHGQIWWPERMLSQFPCLHPTGFSMLCPHLFCPQPLVPPVLAQCHCPTFPGVQWHWRLGGGTGTSRCWSQLGGKCLGFWWIESVVFLLLNFDEWEMGLMGFVSEEGKSKCDGLSWFP